MRQPIDLRGYAQKRGREKAVERYCSLPGRKDGKTSLSVLISRDSVYSLVPHARMYRTYMQKFPSLADSITFPLTLGWWGTITDYPKRHKHVQSFKRIFAPSVKTNQGAKGEGGADLKSSLSSSDFKM